MFSEDERLVAIGKMRREIENTGYAFKSHKRKFALNNRIISIVNLQKKQLSH